MHNQVDKDLNPTVVVEFLEISLPFIIFDNKIKQKICF